MDNWANLLPGFAFAYNNTTHTHTGFTPAYLLYGFQPLTSNELLSQTTHVIGRPSIENSSADTFADGMKAIRTQAKDALKIAQAHQEEYYNKGRMHVEFDVGDLVMINPHSLKLLKGKGRKFQMRYDGPFEINQKISSVAYRLKLPTSYKIHPVINIAHLELYNPDHANKDRPKKHLNRADFEEAPEYEVEKILDEKFEKPPGKKRKIRKYLVRWVGYDSNWDQWESERNLRNAPEVIQEWKASKAQNKALT